MGSLEEKRALQRSANIKVLIAILGSVLIVVMAQSLGANNLLFMALRFLLLIPWFWGLSDYARSKGYSSFLGLLGFLSCIGLLILVILPDKWQETPPGTGSVYPR